jgi:hypothetical protein
MNPRRLVVNVATHDYVALQKELARNLASLGWPAERLRLWTDELPPGSPPHAEAPYAFKLFAFREAFQAGFRSILWVDSPCRFLAPPDALFERIEREGHLLVAGDERLGHWASDPCLAAYGLTRDEALDLPLMNGSLIGLNLAHPRSRAWLDELFDALRRGLFAGPYFSEHAPAYLRARKPRKPVGFVSPDPRCWGHRHDEAIGTCAARRLGLPLVPAAEIYSAVRIAT